MKLIVIGGVAGGATAAGRLRRQNEQAEIIVLERGPYMSFANCGLPYYVGGTVEDREDLLLETPQSFYRRYRIDVRLQNEVLAIAPEDHTVTIKDHATGETYTETYDKLLISTGAEPIRPKGYTTELANVFTLRTVPDAEEIRSFIETKAPRTAVVVGGGYIGLEIAEGLAFQGLSVTLVEQAPQVLPASLDQDMTGEIHKHLREHEIELLLGHSLQNIISEEKGVSLALASPEGEHSITADMAVLALGVRPESGLAQAADLTLGVRNAIAVDKYLRTSDPDIYAVGDAVEIRHFVSGKPAHIPLAGPANKQARVVADNMLGEKIPYRGSQGSAIVKLFDMTVASTGLGLIQAEAAGFTAESVVVYDIDHAGYYPGAQELALKVIYEKNTGTVLGAQVVGFGGVDKRADVLATAIRGHMTTQDLAELDLHYAPPYGTTRDIVNLAGMIAENARSGQAPLHQWSDVDSLPRDGSITLLDVRTPEEVEQLPQGYVQIPLLELRERWQELDPSKPVFLSCYSGHRSYVASRILAGQGFEVSVLCGGWRLYDSAKENEK